MALHEPDCLTIDCQRPVCSVASSPDGKMIAGGIWGEVRLWCSSTGRLLAELNHPQRNDKRFLSVAFMPRNDEKQTVSTLAAGCSDGVYLWDTSTCTSNEQPLCKLEGHTGIVNSVCFTADGQKLVSGSRDSSIRIWDLDSPTHQQLLQLSGHSDWVTSVATTGNRIASGSMDRTVRIWDMTTGTQLLQMNNHTEKVWTVACLPVEGGLCSHIVASGGSDKSIRLWDMSTGQQIAKLDGHDDWIRSITFADGKTLVSAGWDGTIRLWDLSTRRPLHMLKGYSISIDSVAFSSDGKRIVSGSDDGFVRIWNL